ncbi:potassium voltage-gated channel subfamily KQT member 1-like [Rhopilema esculentum]|uniref:potassium voltage-gated channel subfamily KQT member 1-like n=1 Tax=Rhopilema esculentum TaxID=499914 RepID=UPI0031D569EC
MKGSKQNGDIELVGFDKKPSPAISERPQNPWDNNGEYVYHLHHPNHEKPGLKRYRDMQILVYNFLERPRSWPSIIYHSCVFLLILLSLVLSVVTTIDQFAKNDVVEKTVFYLEIILIAVFTIEYGLRVWACSSHGTYSGCGGKFKFIRKPYMVIDIIVIIATLVLIIEHKKAEFLNISILRFLRFLQVLRILRLDRQRGAFKMVSQVVYDHRQELLTCWYMSFIILITCSFLVYLAERSSATVGDNGMENLADGLYWGIISLLTIGYGDISPQTWVAKLITCCFSLVGTAFFALPAGILGSGFALQVAQHQREKHFNNRRIPAAILIQSCWRRYATDPINGLHATWIRYLRMIDKRKLPRNDTKSPGASPSVASDNRRSIIKKLQLVRTSSLAEKFRNRSNDSESREDENQLSVTGMELRTQRTRSDGDLTFIDQLPTDDENQSTITSLPSIVYVTNQGTKKAARGMCDLLSLRKELTSTERVAIRFIAEVQFILSIKKFKEARRPYDVKDVIEQYTAGQMEMFSYIKKLQSRIEVALGLNGDEGKDSTKMNVLGRLSTLERRVESIDRKLDLVIKMLHDSNKVRTDRASSFTNTRLNVDPRHSHETLEQKPPRSPSLSRLKTRKKNHRFKVTIIDAKDYQDEQL